MNLMLKSAKVKSKVMLAELLIYEFRAPLLARQLVSLLLRSFEQWIKNLIKLIIIIIKYRKGIVESLAMGWEIQGVKRLKDKTIAVQAPQPLNHYCYMIFSRPEDIFLRLVSATSNQDHIFNFLVSLESHYYRLQGLVGISSSWKCRHVDINM